MLAALFASVVLAQLNPAPPAPARIPHDFRLIGRDGPRAGMININAVSIDAAGRRTTYVYLVTEDEPPVALAIEATFDCRAGTVALGHTRVFDRSLNLTEEGNEPVGSRTPETGSIYGNALVVVCGDTRAWANATYLGSDWRSAIRAVDARFR